MKHLKAVLFLAVGLGIWFAGCKVTKKGTAYGNQPPTTTISVAPRDSSSVNHFQQFKWSGNDPDGQVIGYWVIVDSDTITFTTLTDTTIAFSSPDSILPGTPHHFSVVSEDNEGMADPNPPVLFFYAFNFSPSAAFVASGTIPPDSIVGQGFRVTLTSIDNNAFLSQFAVGIDDSVNFAWSRDSVFLFADPALIADTAIFARGVVGVSNASLTPGAHTLYARVKDAGNAMSPLLVRHFTVQAGFQPEMIPGVNGTYGGDNFFPDGSAYIIDQSGTITDLTYAALARDSVTHTTYYGEINAYNYRIAPGDWVGWTRTPEVKISDQPEGEYPFEFIARDVANVTTGDTLRYTVRLVRQRLSTNMIIVEETRNGNGRPSSPDSASVNAYYQRVVSAVTPPVNFTVIRYEGDPSRHDSLYVSPFDLKDAGIILWHSDDKSDVLWSDNQRVLTSFLNKGGRLILSGWDVFQKLTTTGDSMVFSTVTSTGQFGRNELRCFSGFRNSSQSPRTSTGWVGDHGYPSVQIDSSKLIPTWRGALDNVWVFQPRGECTIIGNLAVNNPGSNVFEGHPVAYLYDLSFRVAVFGIPLYFCHEDEVTALMGVLIPHMMQGLSEPF